MDTNQYNIGYPFRNDFTSLSFNFRNGDGTGNEKSFPVSLPQRCVDGINCVFCIKSTKKYRNEIKHQSSPKFKKIKLSNYFFREHFFFGEQYVKIPEIFYSL